MNLVLFLLLILYTVFFLFIVKKITVQYFEILNDYADKSLEQIKELIIWVKEKDKSQ